MCGRFTLYATPEELQRVFDTHPPGFEIRPSYNVAPTQVIPVVVERPGGRRLRERHWGLVPFWAKESAIGARMINARLETLSSKPAFAAALKNRRCLIPANGFYEWKGKAGSKQPYYFHAGTGAPIAFAGLYETWEGQGTDPARGPYTSCTIITTAAGGPVLEVHHRMPVILPPAAWAEWLDPQARDPDRVLEILRKNRVQDLAHHPVSKMVNHVANNSRGCLEPLETAAVDTHPDAAPEAHDPVRGK